MKPLEVLLIERDEFMMNSYRRRFAEIAEKYGRAIHLHTAQSIESAEAFLSDIRSFDGVMFTSSRCSSRANPQMDIILFAVKLRQHAPTMPMVSTSSDQVFAQKLAAHARAEFVPEKMHAHTRLISLILESEAKGS